MIIINRKNKIKLNLLNIINFWLIKFTLVEIQEIFEKNILAKSKITLIITFINIFI